MKYPPTLSPTQSPLNHDAARLTVIVEVLQEDQTLR